MKIKKIIYAIVVGLMTLVCYVGIDNVLAAIQRSFRPSYYFLSLPFPFILGITVNFNELFVSIRQSNKKIDWLYLMLGIFFVLAIFYFFYYKAHLIMMMLSAYSVGCIIPKLVRK